MKDTNRLFFLVSFILLTTIAFAQDDCEGLTQDECAIVDFCEWISDSDDPTGWGMCVEVENDWEDNCAELSQDECFVTDGCEWSEEEGICFRSDDNGPPECLMDCEGIENINPDENPYEACDWIITLFGFDPQFDSCTQDCDDEIMIEINEVVEACYDCLQDSTLDCTDVFDDSDDNWECSDLGYEECMEFDFCEWISDSDDSTGWGMCVEAGNDWEDECSGFGYEECMEFDFCEWISDSDDPTGWGMCVEAGNDWEDDGGDDGGWWEDECSGFGYEECMEFDFCEWISDSDDPTGWGMCVEAGNDWEDDGGWWGDECSDFGYEECMDVDFCEWISDSDDSTSWGMCVEIDDNWNDGCWEGGEFYCYGCELFINDCEYYECTGQGWIGPFIIDNDECQEPNNCSDLTQDECMEDPDCEWAVVTNPNGVFEMCVDGEEIPLSECDYMGYEECEETDFCEWEYDSPNNMIGSCVEIDDWDILWGDMNNDGIYNVLDVVAMVECILYYSCDDYADLSGDGEVNVIDVVQLVDIILNN